MTQPTPTPKKQNPPATPDPEKTRPNPNAKGFFRRVRQELDPEPVHPSERDEIVVMDEGD